MKKTYIAIAAAVTALTLSASAFAEVYGLPYDPSQEYDEVIPPDAGVAETTVCGIEVVTCTEATAISEGYAADTAHCVDTAPVENSPAPKHEHALMDGYLHGTGDIEYIFLYWEEHGYPDDVSYVADQSIISYDVETQTETEYKIHEIGLVNGTEARKQEICALIAPDVNIFFTDCVYTHSQRQQVADEINAEYPNAEVRLSPYSQAVVVYLGLYNNEEAKEIEYALYDKYNTGGVMLVEVDHMLDGVGVPETAIEIEDPVATAAATEAPRTEAPSTTVPAVSTIPQTGAERPEEEIGVVTGVDAIGTEGAPPHVENAQGNETAVSSNADAATFEEILTTSEESLKIKDSEKEQVGGLTEIGASQEVAAVTVGIDKKEDNKLWVWICAVAAAAGIITAAVLIGRARRHGSVLSAAHGGEVVETRRVSKAEIIEAVKESEIEPSDKVFEEIVKKIGK